ncbi:DUF2200 domain-containing protein [Mobilicoccus sp.]|uniref:DUF2200 domain-containing protein n=1 Tax=Mobilicoccus sp. TaxID=2034349 RepID=UPI0028A60F18|nr:DUF2200 domain-containing protein [Mobilicoccus sp.]
MAEHRIFTTAFADIYPHYVAKVTRKGRSEEELVTVLEWLTGYDEAALRRVVANGVDLRTFFAEAPELNPRAALITGVICGHRVEDITDPLMQRIRWMDKLVDELARGKKLASILRGSDVEPPSATPA